MNDMIRRETSTVVRSLDDAVNLGGILAKSGFFADSREAAQCVTKILAGQELGIGPVAAMTGIYIVKGRVTLSANLIGAAIKRSGRYNYRVLRMDNDGCAIEFYEHGEAIGCSTFEKQDAVAAGLVGGDNWKKFPRNMYFARAMSNGAKWYCPDVFAGPIYTPDELGERVDGETGEPIDVTPPAPQMTVVELPKPAKPEVTAEQAEALYWERFEAVLGARDWALVQRLIDTDEEKPSTVAGWRNAWKWSDQALAAEAEQAA